MSTFSGCGGSSLGYQLAGGKVLLAVEWDDNAVETYRLNFPTTPIYHGDVGKLTVERCCELAGVGPGELDILDGSPACQGFSTAGKRDFGDDRNQLFREYIRLLKGLRPRVFVMENVSGVVKGKMKLIFAECLRELKASGYKVRARVLNAMYYNVPQSRKRLIFVGVREDVAAEPGHPKAQTIPQTVRQAIGADGSFWNSSYKWTLHHRRPFAAFTKTRSKSHMISTGGRIRYVNDQEIRIAASYPESYRFTDEQSALARIGNSVPPNFMRAIAEHIYETVLKPNKSDRGALRELT